MIRILLAIKRGYKERFLVLRKTQPALRRSVFALLKDYIDKYDMNKAVRVNKTDMTFAFAGGSDILCCGLDDREKIKSIEGVTSVWIEEATEINKEDFMQVDLRPRGENIPSYVQLMMSFNPIGKLSWLNHHFFEQSLEDAYICHSTYKDNKFADPASIKVIEDLKNHDETYYQVYGLGQWGVLQNLIFTNWEVKNISTKDDDYDFVLNGLDFGFNHASALLRIGFKDDELNIFTELYERGLTNNELIPLVKRAVPSEQVITADSAEPARIEEFKQAGVWIKASIKGKGSVKDGIDWAKRHKINVHPRCVNTIKEFSGYKYKEDKDGNVFDEPVPFMDDAMSALRYAVEDLMRADAFASGDIPEDRETVTGHRPGRMFGNQQGRILRGDRDQGEDFY